MAPLREDNILKLLRQRDGKRQDVPEIHKEVMIFLYSRSSLDTIAAKL
jgi:hypothetical protein